MASTSPTQPAAPPRPRPSTIPPPHSHLPHKRRSARSAGSVSCHVLAAVSGATPTVSTNSLGPDPTQRSETLIHEACHFLFEWDDEARAVGDDSARLSDAYPDPRTLPITDESFAVLRANPDSYSELSRWAFERHTRAEPLDAAP